MNTKTYCFCHFIKTALWKEIKHMWCMFHSEHLTATEDITMNKRIKLMNGRKESQGRSETRRLKETQMRRLARVGVDQDDANITAWETLAL